MRQFDTFSDGPCGMIFHKGFSDAIKGGLKNIRNNLKEDVKSLNPVKNLKSIKYLAKGDLKRFANNNAGTKKAMGTVRNATDLTADIVGLAKGGKENRQAHWNKLVTGQYGVLGNEGSATTDDLKASKDKLSKNWRDAKTIMGGGDPEAEDKTKKKIDEDAKGY